MKMSETITKISAALTKSWGEIENPKHNKRVTVRMKNGGQYNFEYTDLGGIIDTVRPVFKENGISIIQHAYTDLIDNRPFISVVTKLMHTSGEWIESKPLQILASQNIQDMGGQITYMKRYSLSALLGISTEEDDDANGSVGNQAIDRGQNKQPEKQVSKAIVLAKWKQVGGTEEQFNEWYKKQISNGHTHNDMDKFLLKRLTDNNAQTST